MRDFVFYAVLVAFVAVCLVYLFFKGAAIDECRERGGVAVQGVGLDDKAVTCVNPEAIMRSASSATN